ncbi:alpha/beta hydrolase [Adlercreutzia sp. ZJ304]|uniref:alpha/beta hydrolase n=1 Tax=Adlercreutzia sp. ZJ304 TaxID=2709791 RepID=UPI0013ED607C|nr:alpha/beta hydrolase [Adlercreutzia sp. ZJ304]
MPLNKAIVAAAKAITRLKAGNNIQESYKQQRIAEDATSKLTVVDPRCRVDNITATSKDGYDIPLRVFTPLDIDFSLRNGLHVNDDFRGTILFFHGGGWANGDVDFYTDSCMRTALKLERRLLAVDYRRSPEYKFPTALEDCYEVARQLFAGELLYDVDPEHIVIFGDSAGGNLAAAMSLLARDRGEFLPRAQMLLYPLVYDDHSETTIFNSVRENGEEYLLTREEIVGYINMYLSKPEDLESPYFAPLIADDLSNQPRTLVISAEFCPLRDEGEVYAERLHEDGNAVECFRMIDGIHGYFLYPAAISLVRDTYTIMKHFLDGDELPAERRPAWIKLIDTN